MSHQSHSAAHQPGTTRIAGPDDLHELMTVVNAQDWILLLAISILFVLAGVWSVFGSVRTTVGGRGVLVQSAAGSDLVCTLYIPAEDGESVRPGMTVQITPDLSVRGRSGGVAASVTSVTLLPVRAEDDRGDKPLPERMWVKVTARLQTDRATAGGYRWTSGSRPHLRLLPGTTASARVIIERRAPITYLFPWVKDESHPY